MTKSPSLVVRPNGLRTDLPDGTVRLDWLDQGLSVQLGPAAIRLTGEFALPRTERSVVNANGKAAPKAVEQAIRELIAAGVLVEFDPNGEAQSRLRSLDGGVFGLPVHTLQAALNGDFDTIVAGVVSDSGTSYRPGSRFAPAVVRRLSRSVMTLDGSAGVFDSASADGLLVGRRIADVGDVGTPHSFQAANLTSLVAEVVRHGAAMVTIGGDHSISLPAIRAAAQAHPGRLGVIHIDAHHDYGRPRAVAAMTSAGGPDESTPHHGNFLDWVVGDSNVAKVVHAGARQLTRVTPTPTEKRVVWPGRQALADSGNAFIESLDRDRPWYLTVDVDVLDPAVMPDTGTPVPGGWLAHELIDLIRAVGETVPVIAADVVEYLPSGVEWPGVTVGHLLAHILEAVGGEGPADR